MRRLHPDRERTGVSHRPVCSHTFESLAAPRDRLLADAITMDVGRRVQAMAGSEHRLDLSGGARFMPQTQAQVV